MPTNILASGCSFTADGLGGRPPEPADPGGNSFRQDPDYEMQTPVSWASHLANIIDPDSFCNLAGHSHGNFFISKTIIDCLEKFNYLPGNTLVLFNISEMNRFDVVCDFSHKDKCEYIPWTENVLDYAFLKKGSAEWKQEFFKTTNPSIEAFNIAQLKVLFEYLVDNNFKFAFTLMQDYLNYPIINEYQNFCVPLPYKGMYEFCKSIGETVSVTDMHPTTAGHLEIANLTKDFLEDKILLQ